MMTSTSVDEDHGGLWLRAVTKASRWTLSVNLSDEMASINSGKYDINFANLDLS